MSISVIWVLSIMALLWTKGAILGALLVPLNLYIMHTVANEMKQDKKEEKKCQE
jgi:ABC-type Na+ efflux pump permease subunit